MKELKYNEIMTEEELRAIDPAEFEGKEYPWQNGELKADVICIYDYDIGLSLVKVSDHEDCYTGIPGPKSIAMNADLYKKSTYHKWLTSSFKMLRGGRYNARTFFTDTGQSIGGGQPSCSFT